MADSKFYRAINQYWLDTFGEYPDGEESSVIVMVVAALQSSGHLTTVPTQRREADRDLQAL